MHGLAHLALWGLLLSVGSVPPTAFRKPARPLAPPPELAAEAPLPVIPDFTLQQAEPPPQGERAEKLQPLSRLTLLRYIHGEFARVVNTLPATKKGFKVKAGEPYDEQRHRAAVTSGGAAASPGDAVQITALLFREKEIILEINGGARKRTSWRDRIQVSMSGGPAPRGSVQRADGGGGVPGFQGQGATIILDFDKPIPDLTPDELKELLAQYLDFSRQRSAAVQWIETLPEEFQQAIRDKRAVEGMDREMVLAAMGRPDQKVRERDIDGNEVEDWIYGQAPGKMIFVKFQGEKVISVREF